jgi:Caspase domain
VTWRTSISAFMRVSPILARLRLLGLSAQERRSARIVATDRTGKQDMVELAIGNDNVLSVVFSGAAPEPTRGEGVGTRLPPDALAPLGTYHALVIGNNRYRALPRLETAVNDAQEIAAILQKDYGYKVSLLIDATRYAILTELNRLRETLTEKDHLLIYYAGHGELDRVNQRGHWLPVDADRTTRRTGSRTSRSATFSMR